MKVGIIRCRKTQERCLFFGCLNAMKQKIAAFEIHDEEIEMIGINDCGGCPGEMVVERAVGMIRMGKADTIALTTCAAQRDCEHSKNYIAALTEKLEEGVILLDREEMNKRVREIPEGTPKEEAEALRAKIEKECEGDKVSLGQGLRLLDRTH